MAQRKRKKPHVHRTASAAEPELFVTLWVVAFLDLLGYREALKKFDVFPPPASDPAFQAGFIHAVRLRRRLFGMVEDFRKGMKMLGPAEWLANLPPEGRKLAEKWRRIEVIRAPGPDHLILGCSLAPSDNHFPMHGVHTLISTAAMSMLVQLMLGAEDPSGSLPLRGGIDLAPGAHLMPEDFLYSPALTRAYDIEQHEAVYARTVIGQRVIDYLQSHAFTSAQTLDQRYTQILAKLIWSDFLFKDKDERMVLNFLGPGLRRFLDKSQSHEYATKAWRFVRAAESTHRLSGDSKVAAKYAWLVDYMQPRLGDWGVAR